MPCNVHELLSQCPEATRCTSSCEQAQGVSHGGGVQLRLIALLINPAPMFVLALALQVFSLIILIELFGSPFMRSAALVIALLVGTGVAAVATVDGNRFFNGKNVQSAPAITFLWVKRFPLGELGNTIGFVHGAWACARCSGPVNQSHTVAALSGAVGHNRCSCVAVFVQLKLACSHKITGAALQALPDLEQLRVVRCRGVNQSSLRRLTAALPNLVVES